MAFGEQRGQVTACAAEGTTFEGLRGSVRTAVTGRLDVERLHFSSISSIMLL